MAQSIRTSEQFSGHTHSSMTRLLMHENIETITAT